MREFIKTHPWRLEIVPALSVLWCLYGVAYYYLRLADRFEPWRFRHVSHGTLGISVFVEALLITVCFWTTEIGMNHKWALYERRKRFNYLALLVQIPMLSKAWLVFLVLRFLRRIVAHSGPETPWLGSASIFLVGLGITAVMEATRVHVPRESTELPPPTGVITGDGEFLYREVQVDWSTVVSSLFLLGVCCIMAVLMHDPVVLPMGFIGCGLLGWLGYRKVTLTPLEIRSSVGFLQKRVRISEIVEYKESYSEFYGKLPPGVRRSAQMGFGPCLEMKMCDGKIHLFGMLRPHFACGLIESARSKSPAGSELE